MFGNRRKQAEGQLNKIERDLDRIWTALVVRDPGTSLAAEAYEGLRRQVIAGASARQAHVAQLAEFDVALRRGATIENLRALSDQWLSQAGVTVIDDPTIREVFDSAVPPDSAAEVEMPAYIITQTQQLVRQGRLREPQVEERPSTDELLPEGQGARADAKSSKAAPTSTDEVEPEVSDADHESTSRNPGTETS